MANPAHVTIIERGVEEWNQWRGGYDPGRIPVRPDLRGWDASPLKVFDFSRFVQQYVPHPGEIQELFGQYCMGNLSGDLQRYGWLSLDHADLSQVDLTEADLSGISLVDASLVFADLSRANLDSASLVRARLYEAKLVGTRLNSANLSAASFQGAKLTGAKLSSANLSRADLTKADLSGADLSGANLQGAILVETNLEGALLAGCQVYGLSAWSVNTKRATQTDLVISPQAEPSITVDNLEVAQFVYLLLNNEKLRKVIDTITSKIVLILGRFTTERKAVLDSLREHLRQNDYIPILFDFDKPDSRDLTETISTLAHMARFVIADLTDARSLPQELDRIVPLLPSVPVQPIILASQREYALFEHFTRFPWVLAIHEYSSARELLKDLPTKVIEPAEAKVREMTTTR